MFFNKLATVLALVVLPSAFAQTMLINDQFSTPHSWQEFKIKGSGSSSTLNNTLTISADTNAIFGLYHPTVLSGHFEIETEFSEDYHVALGLFNAVNGIPDTNNFIMICIDKNSPGQVLISAHDRQNGVSDILDNTGLASRSRYTIPLTGFQHDTIMSTYSVPYTSTDKRLRILRHAGERFFHLYWGVRQLSFAAKGTDNPGWMELAPSKEWSQLSGNFMIALIARNGKADFKKATARQLLLNDPSDSLTGFTVANRNYTWSGYTGNALVVSFGKFFPYYKQNRKFVFWTLANYVPFWHMSDSLGVTYEFVETWDGGSKGCLEPMSDRNLRFSKVEIVENNAVRKIIHWHYVLCDPNYRIPDNDLGTQLPEVDEWYTFYPDGTGTRLIRYTPKLDTQFRKWNELFEYIVIAGNTTKPEEHVSNPALTWWAYNKDGYPKSYYPVGQYADNKIEFTGLGEMTAILHFKSNPDVFCSWSDNSLAPLTYPGSNALISWTISWHKISTNFWHWPINVEQYQDFFATRWPVAQWNQPSHASLCNAASFNESWTSDTKTVNGRLSREWVSLLGLNDSWNRNQIKDKTYSWLYPGTVTMIDTNSSTFTQYRQDERCFIFTSKDSINPSCKFTISHQAPSYGVLNPAIRIKNWGLSQARVSLNSVALDASEIVQDFSGRDLLLWINKNLTNTTTIAITKAPITRYQPSELASKINKRPLHFSINKNTATISGLKKSNFYQILLCNLQGAAIVKNSFIAESEKYSFTFPLGKGAYIIRLNSEMNSDFYHLFSILH
jgi:hypothetical protein